MASGLALYDVSPRELVEHGKINLQRSDGSLPPEPRSYSGKENPESKEAFHACNRENDFIAKCGHTRECWAREDQPLAGRPFGNGVDVRVDSSQRLGARAGLPCFPELH